jgi:hypothetical protein
MFEENLGRVFADYYRYTQRTENPVSLFKFMIGKY